MMTLWSIVGRVEEHVEHLRAVFQILRDNQLYVKKEK